jgi:prepilin-type N-terminal cleavage/methylation domain-containing protein
MGHHCRLVISRGASRRGFTIAEVLIATLIISILAVAIGFTIDGSARAFAVNSSEAEAVQRARNAVNQMVERIRRLDPVETQIEPITESIAERFRNGEIVPDSGFVVRRLEPAGWVDVLRCWSDLEQGTLMLWTVEDDEDRVLARNISAFEATLFPELSQWQTRRGDDARGWIRTAAFDITVQTSGPNPVPISFNASATPVRNDW